MPARLSFLALNLIIGTVSTQRISYTRELMRVSTKG